MRQPVVRIGGRAGHDDLQRAGFVIGAVPLRAQRDQLLVEIDADPPAHADDHRLAVHRGEPLLEMRDQIARDQLEPVVGAYDGF
jgi:hypothetical protein